MPGHATTDDTTIENLPQTAPVDAAAATASAATEPAAAMAQAAALMDMANLVRPNAIRVAAALELADLIGDGAAPVSSLAAATGTRQDMLAKLLRCLQSLGLLRVADGGYALTELAAPLRRDHPLSVGQYLSATGLFGRLELGLVGLLGTIRTGERAYSAAFGRGYWEEINSDAEYVRALEREGSARIAWDAELIVGEYDWSAVASVTDVGGNNGTLLAAILARHPHLHGVVLDLPNLATLAGRRLAAAGLADRASAVASSFFDPLPVGTEVYLLSGILADWADDDAVHILRRCAEAAGPAGRVVLAEINLDAGSVGNDAAAMDLLLASTMPAPVRSVDQLELLGEKAGLRVTWRGPRTAVRSLIEFRPSDVAPTGGRG